MVTNHKVAKRDLDHSQIRARRVALSLLNSQPMSLFFRNLRRRLLANRKFGKYLLYAVGEILILMIGVLMALQVNNWNQSRHTQNTEIVILQAIKADLQTDHEAFSYDLKVHKQQIISSQIIIEHIENNRQYHDSLAKHFLESCNYTVSLRSNGGYETLKSLGVGIISNTELRDSIIFLYDMRNDFLFNTSRDIQENFFYGEKYVLNSRFEEAENYELNLNNFLEAGITGSGGMIPLDFEQLKDDHEYKYYLKTTKNKHKIFLEVLSETIENISEVVSSIETELNRLEA